MNEMLAQKVKHTLAREFQLPVALLDAPGTTLIPTPARSPESWLILWRVGERIVIRVNPARLEMVQAVVDTLPADRRVSAADFGRVWGVETVEHDQFKLYFYDPLTFEPAEAPPPFTVRMLTTDDVTAFNAFLDTCSEDERDTADLALHHEVAYGALDGDRIAAVATSYEWMGLVDLGVMVDPAYRRQGLGKVVVGALASHYRDDPRLVAYRHDAHNRGSQGIAVGLNFAPYGTIAAVRQKSAPEN